MTAVHGYDSFALLDRIEAVVGDTFARLDRLEITARRELPYLVDEQEHLHAARCQMRAAMLQEAADALTKCAEEQLEAVRVARAPGGLVAGA